MIKNGTTYILGAGFNQCVKNINGLKPPLSTNFFNNILKNKKSNISEEKTQLVYDYIYKYWKKSKKSLLYGDFDLEECFTLLQLQLLEASNNNDQELITNLLKINSTLKFIFIESLCEFESFSNSSNLMLSFASLIYSREPNILTFNYDCNLETAIETVSSNKWNSFLSYGVKFDKIQRIKNNGITYIKKEDFYNMSNSSLYNWNILKLHGSLNWFKCIPASEYTLFKNYRNDVNCKKAQFILADTNRYFNEHTDNNLIVDPLIIPPVLYKDYSQDIISTLWDGAKEILSCCKTLIVIGYSFPPTDFGIKKLLLEAFEFNRLDNLIIVDPNTSVINTVKQLTHYNKPALVCNDLSEFLDNTQVMSI
ncbi:SIR2 family protein [Clostridium pasteurianum]|uniref:SIR2-like domain-containing protein n=1 Tax=Clostridium pasteurianum BC1 TaxID=86416 RepID=R4K0A7_CLOPA|nr:SIR2 family protein [Clostridium pasteurianum]AGK95226.1 hypothetical protein Clopa_0145 [Clostridium pasteurianum BC1]